MINARVATLAAGLLLLSAAPALAQFAPWTGRGFVNVSFANQREERSDNSAFTFTLYEEEASVALARTVSGGTFPDLMGGARVWKNVGIGGQFSQRTVTSAGAVVGSIPDPAAFEAPRLVSGTAADLLHRERWVSLVAVYLLPLTHRLDLMGFGGASIVKLEHEVVDGISVVETASAPTLTFNRTVLSRSVWGYVAGVDLRYMFTDHLGAGAFARVQSAQVHLPSGGVTVETGGAQAGAGVRIGF